MLNLLNSDEKRGVVILSAKEYNAIYEALINASTKVTFLECTRDYLKSQSKSMSSDVSRTISALRGNIDGALEVIK